MRDTGLLQPAGQDIAIALVQVAIGVAAIAMTWRYGAEGGVSMAAWARNLGVAALGMAAAMGSLRGRRWGLWAGLLFFACQLVHVSIDGAAISLMPNFNLSVTFGSGPVEVAVNLLALAMLAWAGWRASRRLTP